MMRELRALTAGSYTEEADSILLKQKVHVMVKRNEELAILLKEAIRLADLTGQGGLAQSTMGGSMLSKLNSALNLTQQEVI
jgi:hypothetical protein